MMIAPTPPTVQAGSTTQDTAQPHAKPAVQGYMGGDVAVLEIPKPANRPAIDVLNDRPQAVAVRAMGLGSDRIFELAEALCARPPHVAFKVIAQKVESPFLGGIYNPRLVRMQRQSCFSSPLPHPFKRFFSFSLALAQNHEVVGISHHLDPLPFHLMVQRVQIDVRKQRTYDGPLRSSLLRFPPFHCLHHILSEIRFQHRNDGTIRYFLLHLLYQRSVLFRSASTTQVSPRAIRSLTRLSASLHPRFGRNP
jgi:hypothetical protein